MKAIARLLVILCLCQVAMAGDKKSKIASVPFEVVGTYIVIKAKINKSTPLNFILDSGLGTTLITHMDKGDSISLPNSDKTVLRGLGKGNIINAVISYGNTLQTGRMKFVNQTIYFIEDDLFNLSEYTGRKINGLLGSDFFQDLAVKIDYGNRRITFYESSSFKVPKGYVPIHLTINEEKMYATLQATESDGKVSNVNMLIDTGAELAAWFRTFGDDKIKIPDKKLYGYIGQGLNGEITGYLARLPKVGIGGHNLSNPVISFPDSSCISGTATPLDRDGTIGSQILSRYNIIIDEPNGMLYVKPNNNFRKPFTYNIAGIEVLKRFSIPYLPEVFLVWKGSPAEKSGIKAGDMLLSVNEINGFGTDISEIRHIFETRSRRPIYIKILREGKTLDFKIDMNGSL